MRDWGQLGEASLTSSHSLAAPSGTPSPLLNNIIHLGTRIHTPGSAGESTALTCTSRGSSQDSCASQGDSSRVLPPVLPFHTLQLINPCCA